MAKHKYLLPQDEWYSVLFCEEAKQGLNPPGPAISLCSSNMEICGINVYSKVGQSGAYRISQFNSATDFPGGKRFLAKMHERGRNWWNPWGRGGGDHL